MSGFVHGFQFLPCIGRALPVADECQLFLMFLLQCQGFLFVKCGFGVGEFLVVGIFLVEPVAHLLSPVALLLVLALLSLKFINLFDDVLLILVIEQGYVLELVTQQVALVLFGFAGLIDLHAHVGINLGTRHLLEQFGFVVFNTIEKFSELALSKHHSAEELVDIQSQKLDDVVVDLSGAFFMNLNLRSIICAQGAFGLHDSVFDFPVLVMDVPCGDIGCPVIVIKGEFDIGAYGASAQELSHVVGLEAILAGTFLAIGCVIVAPGII